MAARADTIPASTAAAPAKAAAAKAAPPAGQGGQAAVSSVNLNPLRVFSSLDPGESMKIDPDEDYSELGKPRVLTTTTTRETLEDRMINDFDDYSRRVDASVNYNANNFSINMRGLDQNRLLTTIDGIRMVWADDGARGVQGGVVNTDFNSFGAIDIVKSSDSSFFGTGSLGGIVAIRTLDPEDILKSGKTFGGLSQLTYDGASASAYLNQAFAGRVKNTLFLVQGGYRTGSELGNMGTVGGIGPSRSEKNPATYNQGNFLGKIRHYFGNEHRLTVTGENFNRNYDEDTLTSVDNAEYKSYKSRQQNSRSRVSATYDYLSNDPGRLINQAHLTAYWQRVGMIDLTEASRLTAPAGAYNRDSDLDIQSYGVVGSITAHAVTGPVKHAVTLGGEAYLTDTSQYSGGQDNCNASIFSCNFLHTNQADMPRVHGTDLGVILQDRLSIGRNDWLHITPGFRFDSYERDPRNTPGYQRSATYHGLPGSSSGTHVSPKVLVEANVTRNLVLYGQYAQAFRAPSATELYLNYGGNGTYIDVGNPNLRPETSRGWEIGAKYGTSRRGAGLSFYDNEYSNFIDTVTTTAAAAGVPGNYPFGVFEYINRQHVRIYGVEASANWAFDDHWQSWASLAYANGQDTDLHVHLNSVAPFRGIVGIGYKQTDWGASLSTTFAAARNQVQDPSSNLNKTPAYAIVDLVGWYTPSFVQGVKLQAGLYNLFNKTYYNALNIPDSATIAKQYYTQPGRSVRLTALISF